MFLLDGANEKVQVVTGSAADLRVHASYMENNAGTVTPKTAPVTAIAAAATTDVVGVPTAGKQRNVKEITARNAHASTSTTVKFQMVDGTNTEPMWEGTLLAGEMVVFDETGAWTLYDTNGQVKPSTGAFATQADMEAGTSLVLAVTPGRLGFHPGNNKFWVNFTGNSTTINASYNMTSITDGTTEATVTIATDFSSANWCAIATAEGAVTTVAGARLACVRAIAAGSIIVFCVDGSATTALVDPTRWHVTGLGDQ